jgi:SAM-dependent methyltransferase
MLGSIVCRQEQFEEPWYREWETRMGLNPKPGDPVLNRKPWEFAAVAQTLRERGMLEPGKRGLGFAVGTEPLPSLFASFGVEVVATDLQPRSRTARIWRRSNQHGDCAQALFKPDLIEQAAFDQRVCFMFVDMNGRWPWKDGSFDFVWSCCAFEHLGSLAAGLRFVERAAKLLRPGGVAAHTTEYNCSSNEGTVEKGPGVIYRRRDIERLDHRLRSGGRCLACPDFWVGDGEHDRRFDIPPYFSGGRQHVKLEIDGYVATSMLVTVLT